jgi:hypothetical protein
MKLVLKQLKLANNLSILIAVMRLLQRGSRSLIQNLASVSGDMHIQIEHSPGDKAVVAGVTLGDHVSPVVESEDTEEDFEVPDILEEVIEQLLAGLRDKVLKIPTSLFYSLLSQVWHIVLHLLFFC